MSRLVSKNIKLLVCDMAGTTVNEKGIIYKTLKNTLNNMGFKVKNEQVRNWYGKDKSEVLRTHISQNTAGKDIEKLVKQAEKNLLEELEETYFKDNNVSLMDYNLLIFFEKLRSNGIKVALNTGYPSEFQEKIIDHLHMRNHIDSYISSESVSHGRPHPYMIDKLAEEFKISDNKYIAKIGDTVPDMLEGKNANCGMVIGTLTGAENYENLAKNADFVVKNIMELDDLSSPYQFLTFSFLNLNPIDI
jgi:phosphonatase-like hydrolase